MQRNPFKPTAGKTPPELIDREDVLLEFDEGLENGPGAPGRLMRISGVRGMGKTAVLNELGSIASQRGWKVIDETASTGFNERILSRLNYSPAIQQASIHPQILGVSLGGVDFKTGEVSLQEAMEREARKDGLLITLDELQDVDGEEVKALVVSVQHVIRQDLDIAFVFAGLPSMVDGVINSKSLTILRRAVPFELGALSSAEVSDSYEMTIAESGMGIKRSIAEQMAEIAAGYPFMVQLVGYYTWQRAARMGSDSIEAEHVELGARTARLRFAETVIEPALHRVSPEQARYLLAMSEGTSGVSSTSEVASRLGKGAPQLSAVRQRLIDAEFIDASAWGKVRFAIPYMGEYLRENRERLLLEISGS